MSYNNNVYRVTLKCMAYVFDIQFPTYSLLYPPPYARVAAPFLEGGPSCFASGRRPASVSVWHTINQNGQMFVNIKKNKKGSCDDWTFIYTTTTADIVILPFFFRREGLFRVLCAFVLCANRTDPKNLSRRERGREKSLSISFVAVLRNGRNDVKRLPSLPCRQATTVIRILFVQRETNNLFFCFVCFLLRSFFIVWCSCGHKVHPLHLWTLRL
jgi:hypothetical protein